MIPVVAVIPGTSGRVRSTRVWTCPSGARIAQGILVLDAAYQSVGFTG
jgi:hypothetical protein